MHQRKQQHERQRPAESTANDASSNNAGGGDNNVRHQVDEYMSPTVSPPLD